MSNWIKCSDRMPAVKDFLLVYDGVEAVRAYYYQSGNIFIRDNCDELYRVTHWQPLPTPPEGQ